MPLALDTYFRGNSAEVAFCQQIGAGGNHLVVTTAAGRVLGDKRQLRLREQELAPVLREFRQLPAAERQPGIEVGDDVEPPQRPVPQPPPGGLILRGFCTYLEADNQGRLTRPTVYYYQQNPDRWQVETQSDMLWLTAAERRSLLPDDLRPGATRDVERAIQHRFFSTIGIDYMEGSVNALPVRESSLSVRVESVDARGVALRLEGFGHMGEPFDETRRNQPGSRGCELRVVGRLQCDREGNFSQFDIVGVGRAWGNKMNYIRREISVPGSPWFYGIACERVSGDAPIERIPPYNLLHYNGSGQPYFADESR